MARPHPVQCIADRLSAAFSGHLRGLGPAARASLLAIVIGASAFMDGAHQPLGEIDGTATTATTSISSRAQEARTDRTRINRTAIDGTGNKHGRDSNEPQTGTLLPWIAGRQVYYTTVAAPHPEWADPGTGARIPKAILSQEGAIEPCPECPALTWGLVVDGRPVDLASGHFKASVMDGQPAIPTVEWTGSELRLKIAAWQDPKDGQTYVRYHVGRDGSAPHSKVEFLVDIVPDQVLPPWDSFTQRGGRAHISRLAARAQTGRNGANTRAIFVDGRLALVELTRGSRFEDRRKVSRQGANTSKTTPDAAQEPVEHRGRLRYQLNLSEDSTEGLNGARGDGTKQRSAIVDILLPSSIVHATKIMNRARGRDLETPTELRSRSIAVRLNERAAHGAKLADDRNDATTRTDVPGASPVATASLERAIRASMAALDVGPRLSGPQELSELWGAARANVSFLLEQREGPALEPGSRAYAQSWIRDASTMVLSLLETGHPKEAAAFVEWYAQFINKEGYVPSSVARGRPSPVVENDSYGAFLQAVNNVYRFTHDSAFAMRLWPTVRAVVDAVSEKIAERSSATYERYQDGLAYGLMPLSISHEGYASHPVHAYWDDFHTLRGLEDAVHLARAAKAPEAEIERLEGLATRFSQALSTSITQNVDLRRLGYVPASVELADPDPSAIALLLSLLNEKTLRIPKDMLEKTFVDYAKGLRPRLDGTNAPVAYAPYEIRIVEAFTRLGMRREALELLRYLVKDMHPRGWNQFREVVWKDVDAPQFIGDMPHSWIGAEFVRALRSLFVYEDFASHGLVLGAGIPPEWLEESRPEGLDIKAWPTPFGQLSYHLSPGTTDGGWRIEFADGLPSAPGGLVVRLPKNVHVEEVLVAQQKYPFTIEDDGDVHIDTLEQEATKPQRASVTPTTQSPSSSVPRRVTTHPTEVSLIFGAETRADMAYVERVLEIPQATMKQIAARSEESVRMAARVLKNAKRTILTSGAILERDVLTRLAQEDLPGLANLTASSSFVEWSKVVGRSALNAGFRNNPNSAGRIVKALEAHDISVLRGAMEGLAQSLGRDNALALYARNPWFFFDLVDEAKDAMARRIALEGAHAPHPESDVHHEFDQLPPRLLRLALLLGEGDRELGNQYIVEGGGRGSGLFGVLASIDVAEALARRSGPSPIRDAFLVEPNRLLPVLDALRTSSAPPLPKEGPNRSTSSAVCEETLDRLEALIGRNNLPSFLGNPAKVTYLGAIIKNLPRLEEEKKARSLSPDEMAERLHREMISISTSLR